VLGVAFSFGIPMAFTACGQPLTFEVSALVLSNLLWVLAYDTEYAMVDRDDDLRIGMRTSAITLGRHDVAGVMAFYGGSLLLWAWVMWARLPWWVLALGLVQALAQVLWHFGLIRERRRDGCFKAFRENHWLGAGLFAAVLLAYAWA